MGEIEPDQKVVDPLIPSAHTAAEEPEASTHGDPIDGDVVGGSMGADKAPPFNMHSFLEDTEASRAASAAASEQERAKPDDCYKWSKVHKKHWRKIVVIGK